MTIELTVVVKDSESTLRQKFLCHDQEMIKVMQTYFGTYAKETIHAFAKEAEEVVIKISMAVFEEDMKKDE